MKDKKWVWFSAFRWVVPADYEDWLEQMAAQGWQVDKIGQWSSILMIFKRREPQKVRFVYDLQAYHGKDYKETYKEFGWEFLGQMASVYVWKMPYTGERPEAFTDKPSIKERSSRVIYAIAVSLVLMVLGVLALFVPQVFFTETLTQSDRIQLWIAQGLFLLFALALGGVMLHIKQKSK